MPTRDSLATRTKAELVELARKRRIAGYSRMTKDQLVAALVAASRKAKKRQTAAKGTAASSKRTKASNKRQAKKTTNKSGTARTRKSDQTPDISPLMVHDLASAGTVEPLAEDEAILQLMDPHWLRVCWRVSRAAVERARAALAHEWYRAKPVIRLVDLTAEEAQGTREVIAREEPIDSLTTHWFFHVGPRNRLYRVDVGYLTPEGRFVLLLRTNTVRTPRTTAAVATGARGPEAYSADLRGQLPFASDSVGNGGTAAGTGTEFERRLENEARRRLSEMPLWLHVDAELLVRGATLPDARVEVQGEPVDLSADGTFTIRFPLPEGRQIIPVGVVSSDGFEERTVVLAVERNTKELRPLPFEETSI